MKKNTDIVIYILQAGEWDRQSIDLVSMDVQLISKKYAELTNKKDYSSAYDKPCVEIWKNNESIGYFGEFEKVESKIKKALTKRAMGIN